MTSIGSYPGYSPAFKASDANAQFMALLAPYLQQAQAAQTPADPVPTPAVAQTPAVAGSLQSKLDAAIPEAEALPVASPESERNLFGFSSMDPDKQKIARLQVFVELFQEYPTVAVSLGGEEVTLSTEAAWLKKDALLATAGGGEVYDALVKALTPVDAEYASKISKKNYMLLLGY